MTDTRTEYQRVTEEGHMDFATYEEQAIATFRQRNPSLCDYTRIQADESGLVWVAWEHSAWMMPFKVMPPLEKTLWPRSESR